MYCVLVIVFGFLALASAALLIPCAPHALGALLGFLAWTLVAELAYATATASARAYGDILIQIAKHPEDVVEEAPKRHRSPIGGIAAWISRAP